MDWAIARAKIDETISYGFTMQRDLAQCAEHAKEFCAPGLL